MFWRGGLCMIPLCKGHSSARTRNKDDLPLQHKKKAIHPLTKIVLNPIEMIGKHIPKHLSHMLYNPKKAEG